MPEPDHPAAGRIWLPLGALLVGVTVLVLAVMAAHANIPSPTNVGLWPAATSGSVPSQAQAQAQTQTQVTATAGRREQPVQGGAARPAKPPAGKPRTTASPKSGTNPSRTGPIDVPVTLSIPRLEVTAVVDPVANVGGVLQVPDDPARVGWWKASAPAGSSAGTTVVDGHIDSAARGIGALFHLAEMKPGDQVTVTTRSGTVVRYQVQARHVYAKEQGLPAEVFAQDGPGRLVLISCGGTFDPSIRSYDDNIVVLATPVK